MIALCLARPVCGQEAASCQLALVCCSFELCSSLQAEQSDQLPVCVLLQVHSNGPVLDDEILADPAVQECIKNETSLDKSFNIYNVDRACLGRVGGAIAKLHGDSGFAGSLNLNITVSRLPSKSLCHQAHITLNGMLSWGAHGVAVLAPGASLPDASCRGGELCLLYIKTLRL